MAVVHCAKCDQEGEALSSPPMGGQIGLTLQSRVCLSCWEAWLADQARFINHYGLQMADPDDRKKLMQTMKEYLHLQNG